MLFFGLCAPAQSAVDLFQARVPVADQTEAARTTAVAAALAAVLVRVTGDARIAESPDSKPLMENVRSYLQGTSYEQAGEILKLRATFDGPALTAALHAAGLPFWSANRPSHLLWIGLDGDTPEILDADARETLAPLFEAAEARGVPVILPSSDAQDQDVAEPADIFVGIADTLLKASRRYNAEQIVSVWVTSTRTHWGANWSLLSAKGVTQQWESSGNSAETALAAGIQHLADFEATQFAIRGVSTALSETIVEVDGVQSLADYARALNYLKRLDLAKSVNVVSVQGTRVVFRLRTDSSETQLARVIAAGSVLRESAATARGALGFSLVR